MSDDKKSTAIAYMNKLYKTDGQIKTCVYIPSTHKIMFFSGVAYDSASHKLVVTR